MKLPIFYISFMKQFIDLSALLEVSDVKFFDRMGSGGYYVGFEYRMVGDAVPREYSRPLVDGGWGIYDEAQIEPAAELWYYHPKSEKIGIHRLRLVDGTWLARPPKREDYDKLLCTYNMRTDLVELLNAWQRWKEIEPQVYALLRKE